MFSCCDGMEYWVEVNEQGPRLCRKRKTSTRCTLPANVRPLARSETVRPETVRSTALRSTAVHSTAVRYTAARYTAARSTAGRSEANRRPFEEYITWDTPHYRAFLVPESEIVELGKEAWLDRRRKYRELRESCKELMEKRNKDCVPSHYERSAGYRTDVKQTPVRPKDNTPGRPKDTYVRSSYRSNGNQAATASTRRQTWTNDRVTNSFW
ncbi:hypothetical protein BO94DRAFT_269195 [Aspergillus sclerotioniger CBS 115572]|uniref:Uncharacterized protein n=1 Tax=Aspergillus sclerotioniger CBS 115572 TaxID=1450535 RepID=A0A317VB66_9EURO|nr:hypothetical protein BO94DRAFT_269195 [Aspergillus sclerotioniger CBS 115572]PWY70317.1 hypothetical protein BO94DRAFT_269195 [Aspergillus sclerotioniger CBS 115572]